MSVRSALHAGSWYSSDSTQLERELNGYLTSSRFDSVPKARVIISPHAGYAYCGSIMGKCYSQLALSKIKRIFILGPSHHVYFENKALLSGFDEIQTPLGNFIIDSVIINTLLESPVFSEMSTSVDEAEHSLEMQYPMLYQTLIHRNRDPNSIKLVPILISHNSTKVDYQIGSLLSEYLMNEENCFIISSDFCHWGSRFQYTGYAESFAEIDEVINKKMALRRVIDMNNWNCDLKICQCIKILDQYGMKILNESGNKYEKWKEYLNTTRNTICGEKPIGVLLCALECIKCLHGFQWCGYSQSNTVLNTNESSVSYAAGYYNM